MRPVLVGLFVVFNLALPGASARAATPHPSLEPSPGARYNPLETFAKLRLPHPANAYRAGNGAPGPAYWQNRADYRIHARLLPKKRELVGHEVITYENNSPVALDFLWVRLEQNAYRKRSRSHFAVPRRPRRHPDAHPAPPFTQGFQLDSVEVQAGRGFRKADYLVSDTRMRIHLATPLKPRGRLRLRIAYHYTVPGRFGGRTSWGASKNGDIFDIAQWYPRMAVFDDLRGWDTLPYLANEFYLEYGNFEYWVTVPADMLVAGTGELVNPGEVLTAKERARLRRARHSEKTVFIRGPDEVGDPSSRPVRQGELTWHFRMKHTRDVAFSASKAFVWDAARIDLPHHQSALAMSFYPKESMGPQGWNHATRYIKAAVETFSRQWFPFPWPAAIAVGGPTGGMEYPGMAFDSQRMKGKPLFWISVHEIGHSWFPMVVGFDERRNAWMDEGFNTFIDVLESNDFDHGAFGPKRDSEYAPGGGNPVEEIQKVLRDPNAPPIMTRADAVPERYRHPVSYFKSALGLVLLRTQILGKARFDSAFRKFIRDWAFKHPSPSDFFRAMDSAAGEDLSWFWRGWYFHDWDVDLALRKVAYTDGDPRHGATVTVENLDRLVMPSLLQVTYADGHHERIRIPAEAWIRQRLVEVPVSGDQPIASVELDPDHAIPEADRSNDVLKGPFEGSGTTSVRPLP